MSPTPPPPPDFSLPRAWTPTNPSRQDSTTLLLPRQYYYRDRSSEAYRRRLRIVAPAVLVPLTLLILFLVWRRHKKLKKLRRSREQHQLKFSELNGGGRPGQGFYGNGNINGYGNGGNTGYGYGYGNGYGNGNENTTDGYYNNNSNGISNNQHHPGLGAGMGGMGTGMNGNVHGGQAQGVTEPPPAYDAVGPVVRDKNQGGGSKWWRRW